MMSTNRATNSSDLPGAMVLLSGGVDSTVALYWSLVQGWRVSTVEFEYHQRPVRERLSCRALRDKAGISDGVIVPLEFMREAGDVPVTELRNPELARAPEGYVSARNLVFYSIGAHYAEIRSARYIVGGHTRTDAESFADASPAFFEAINGILKFALWSHAHTKTEIVLPLLRLDKHEVVRLGADLGVPWELTWSCYADAKAPCGSCESCTERRQAFQNANVEDPLVRASRT